MHSLLRVIGQSYEAGGHLRCAGENETIAKNDIHQEPGHGTKGRREKDTGHRTLERGLRTVACRGPSYISPERPCCFFNARTTFTRQDEKQKKRTESERDGGQCFKRPSTITRQTRRNGRQDDQPATALSPSTPDAACR